MRTFRLPAGLVLLAAAMPALAQEPDAAGGEGAGLDLGLPQSARAGYRNDPPGTWYGDTSGVATTRQRRQVTYRYRCPTAPDGKETDITGSVEAGVGYSRHGGNSNWQGATVNYCKEQATDDGGSRIINVQLHVDSSDGPGFYGPHGSGWGPYPPLRHR